MNVQLDGMRMLCLISPPFVVGAALRLVVTRDADGLDDEGLRQAAGLSVYLWRTHRQAVVSLAESMRSSLAAVVRDLAV